MKFFKSLKFRIMAICLAGSLLMTVAIGGILFVDLRRSESEREIESSRHNLRLMMNNINRDYMQVIRFLSWLSDNADISRFLAADPGQADADRLRVNAYNITQKQMLNLSISEIVDKCVISSRDGRYISLGNIAGDLDDYENMLPFIRRNDSMSIQAVIRSPFAWDTSRKVIPLSSRLKTTTGASAEGWTDIFLSTKIITSQMVQFGTDSSLILGLADQLYAVSPDGISEPLPAGADFSGFENGPVVDDVWIGSGVFNGERARFIFNLSPMNGWLLARRLPEFSLARISSSALRPIAWSVLVVFGMSFGVLSLLLASINRPVERIRRRIDRISAGDFSKEPGLETQDELGHIGRGVNDMAASIDRLIHEKLETQRERANFEFRALQNQINPHFLNNTLNSIRWMATIQRADGIVEMTARLSGMLRRMNTTNDALIPLREELDFIRDYAVIQSYRYGDSFHIEYGIEPESLLDAGIVKFTLQPVVENAIFHGIEPKGETGVIRILASKEAIGGEAALVIRVEDDGAGMPPERLETVNRFETARDGRIGLANIHHRIRLEFGPAHGLRVESRADGGTAVRMTLPLVLAGKEAAGCID